MFFLLLHNFSLQLLVAPKTKEKKETLKEIEEESVGFSRKEEYKKGRERERERKRES